MNAFDESISDAELAREITATLSPRELECFVLIAMGRATKQVCEDLNVSYKTVATHRQQLRKKLKVATAEEVAILGWRTRKFLSEVISVRRGPLRRPSPVLRIIDKELSKGN